MSRCTNTRVSILRNTHFNDIKYFQLFLERESSKRGDAEQRCEEKEELTFLLLNLSSFLHNFLHKNTCKAGPFQKWKIHINHYLFIMIVIVEKEQILFKKISK